jgi:rod shape-determining protein MreC
MCLDYRHQYIDSVRPALSVAVAPLQYMATWPRNVTHFVTEQWSSQRALIAENKILRARELEQLVRLEQLGALEQENQQLRALLQAAPRILVKKTLVAEILAVDSDMFLQELVLDKGTRDGIYVGQTVLDAQGIMGQIIQVNALTSRMLLITDTRSGVPVQIVRNGVRGIVVGNGRQGDLSLINLPITTDVQVGDVLVSSTLGARYPAGYPVGIVSSVLHEPDERFATIIVKPSAHVDRSQPVILVWPAVTAPAPESFSVTTKAPDKKGTESHAR